MLLNHIDKNGNIISGPHDVFSTYVKKLTSCGNPDLLDLAQYNLVEYVPPVVEPIPPTYQELRAREYPPIQEQLDMQYWDFVNGTTNWIDLVASIKVKYPKD